MNNATVFFICLVSIFISLIFVGKQITVWYFPSQNTSCKYTCIYISTLDSKYCIVFVYIIFSETNMKLIDAIHNSYRHYAFSAYAWVQSPVVLNDCNCCFSPTNGSFSSKRLVGSESD